MRVMQNVAECQLQQRNAFRAFPNGPGEALPGLASPLDEATGKEQEERDLCQDSIYIHFKWAPGQKLQKSFLRPEPWELGGNCAT